VRLAYEAYEPMARAALERIEAEALRRHAVARCHIVHRLGEVPPGEASVAVVVTAAHRAPAFEACRWAMDEVKSTAPIWKKEHYESGDADWVEGTPL
jgi:molybdopterin synthase catalytic subunit